MALVTISLGASGQAAQVLRGVIRQVGDPAKVLLPVGRRVANDVRRHMRKRKRDPKSIASRNNFPRRGYWNRVAKSVQAPKLRGATTAVVSITDPTFGIKLRGGVIRPKRAKALAIPIAPETGGRFPRVFERETGHQLFVPKAITPRGRRTSRFLAYVEERAGKTRLRVAYVLAQQVTVPKDPLALPPQDELDAAIIDQANQQLARLQGVEDK